MGREIRRVPANWQHPRDERGHYIPLHGCSFSQRAAEWDEAKAKWNQGLCSDYNGGWKPLKDGEQHLTFEEWSSPRPKKENYMPDWPDSERTHIQMYENTTEGTPISPVMESPEMLAHWLADTGASAFADMTATYEEWLATIRAGYSFSAVSVNGNLTSGVEANA